MRAKVRYIDKDLKKLKFIEGNKSDWIDVRVSRIKVNKQEVEFKKGTLQGKELGDIVEYKKGDVLKVYVGFAMQLPKNIEAHIKPRSSLFKHFGLIQTNSVGVIDNSYSGNDDEWFVPFLAMKDGYIKKGERLAQFRVFEKMKGFELEEVEELKNENRGGEGTTGR